MSLSLMGLTQNLAADGATAPATGPTEAAPATEPKSEAHAEAAPAAKATPTAAAPAPAPTAAEPVDDAAAAQPLVKRASDPLYGFSLDAGRKILDMTRASGRPCKAAHSPALVTAIRKAFEKLVEAGRESEFPPRTLGTPVPKAQKAAKAPKEPKEPKEPKAPKPAGEPGAEGDHAGKPLVVTLSPAMRPVVEAAAAKMGMGLRKAVETCIHGYVSGTVMTPKTTEILTQMQQIKSEMKDMGHAAIVEAVVAMTHSSLASSTAPAAE